MKLSRGILYSLLITLVMTLVLQYFIGSTAWGLFLFMPLGMLWNARGAKKRDDPKHPLPDQRNRPAQPVNPDNRPINPK